MTKNRKNRNVLSASSDHRISESEQVVPTADVKGEVATSTAPSSKPPSKQQQLAALVGRDEGATLDQMIAMTGWLPHTTRAALTGLKKKGFILTSDKVDGVRTYRAVAPERARSILMRRCLILSPCRSLSCARHGHGRCAPHRPRSVQACCA